MRLTVGICLISKVAVKPNLISRKGFVYANGLASRHVLFLVVIEPCSCMYKAVFVITVSLAHAFVGEIEQWSSTVYNHIAGVFVPGMSLCCCGIYLNYSIEVGTTVEETELVFC